MSTKSTIGISKYKNINGVTCYMNSILAILQQTEIFTDYIISAKFKNLLQLNNPDLNLDTCIIFQLHKLFCVSLSIDNGIVTPTSLRVACAAKDTLYNRWGSRQQQDSPDFLLFILEKITEEIGQKVTFIPGRISQDNKITNSVCQNKLNQIISTIDYNNMVKSEFSPLTNIFNGLEHATTQCSICKNKNSKFETFKVLEIEIPELEKELDITDCLDKWSEDEILDDGNKYLCSFCGLKSNAIRKHMLMKTPKILIIHFKRFKKDMFGRIVGKNNRKITFPINDFSISKYISPSSQDLNKSLYNLYAVNCHYGLGSSQLNFGHYISLVKNRYNNKWYNFNDSNEPIQITTINELVSQNSYILFYVRTN